MTTHTITGIAVTYGAGGSPTNVDSVVATAITSDVFSLIYSNPVVSPGDDLPTVDLTSVGTEINGSLVSGSTVIDLFDPTSNLDALVGYVVVNGQTIEVLLFFDPSTSTDYIFQLSGPPLTATTIAEWNALDASITAAGPITSGPFAPNTSFGLDDFLTHSSTEHDTITGGATADFFDAGIGNDDVFGLDGNDTLIGGSGNDRLYGGNDDDLLLGDGGSDRLYAGSGNDVVHGGNGSDVAYLGAGDDEFIDTAQSGVNGNDRIFAGDGNDTVRGGGGNEFIHGDAGNDRLFGGDDDDRIYGDAGSDRLFGDAGNDRVYGGGGSDRLYGDSGSDRLYGNSGNDRLFGGNGSDRLYGNEGNDRLEGGRGRDQLSGGADADTFTFRTSFGEDTILDFALGEDTLRIDDAIYGGGLTAAQVVSTYASVVGGEVVFDFGSGDTITLEGVNSLAGLDADVLIF